MDDPRPPSDARNFAAALMRDDTQDQELLRWLIEHRARNTRELLDRPAIWTAVEAVTAALYAYGVLSGADINDLLAGG
jgi:hypothetical protein